MFFGATNFAREEMGANLGLDGRTGFRLRLGLLVVLLKPRDKICLVSSLRKTLLGQQLL